MQGVSEDAPYRDASVPNERRVDDLLSRMTLTEKAAQLGSVNADKLLDGDELDREAGVKALEAGIDVELPYTDCYGGHLVEAVENGELAEETLNEAVRRMLQAKFRTGVFDDPTVDADAAPEAFGTEAAKELTERAARTSMVLLKNEDDLLPLDDADSLAVSGRRRTTCRN